MSEMTPQTTNFRVADLPQNQPTLFEIIPNKETLTALAGELDLQDLRKVRFKGEISGFGKADWQLNARLGATVVQSCVVTLEPVTTRLEVDIQRRFVSTIELPEEVDGEVEMPEDENAELLGTHIDVEQVLAEALALNLPLYPRADGAAISESVFTEPGKKAMTDEDTRPFAGLASLRDKLSGNDGDQGEN